MYTKMLLNDFKNNSWKNMILLLFMCLSVAVTVSVTLLLSQLFSSINAMYKTANPPHYLQMHKGNLNEDDFYDFNQEYGKVNHSQIVSMINLYGEDILVKGKEQSFSLSDLRLDISLVKQNQNYDVLLDNHQTPLQIQKGEIAVPVILLNQYDIKLGDIIAIKTKEGNKEFKVTAYAYDGMMNSTMVSSTRFLVSNQDFDSLFRNIGETEYMLEVWLEDKGLGSEYQTFYEKDKRDLPKSGQAVTYQMIYLLSALTDLMMAMVFIMASIVIIMIALISLRYVVLAELNDDVGQVGTMKAIGIPDKAIKGYYLGKIRFLMICGSIFGLFLARLAFPLFSKHIYQTFGQQPLSSGHKLIAVFVAILIYILIILYSKSIVSRIQKASVMDLLIKEEWKKKDKKIKDGLRYSRQVPINLWLSFNEVRHGYNIVFILLFLVSILIVLPFKTIQTLQDENFVTYMGNPRFDLLVEVEEGRDLELRKNLLDQQLNSDSIKENIKNYDILKRVIATAEGTNGDLKSIHIDTGREAGQGIHYLKGRAPLSDNSIALSVLLADELGKTVGDSLTIVSDNQTKVLTISGIYQDVTSGGKTAKAMYDFNDIPVKKYTYHLTLTSNHHGEKLESDLREEIGQGFTVENMKSFLEQTLGSLVNQVDQINKIVSAIGFFITACITLLFVQLKVTRTKTQLAEKKAIGIPLRSIRWQEILPILFAGGFGMMISTILALLLGDKFISLLFILTGFGIEEFIFAGQNTSVYLMLFALMLIIVLVSRIALSGVDKIKRKDFV